MIHGQTPDTFHLEGSEKPITSLANKEYFPAESAGQKFVLYWQPQANTNGFHLVCLKWVSNSVEDEGKQELYEYEKFLSVWAAFDGIRHLNFCEDDDGYLHYPNLPEIVGLLNRIREIELAHCPDCEK